MAKINLIKYSKNDINTKRDLDFKVPSDGFFSMTLFGIAAGKKVTIYKADGTTKIKELTNSDEGDEYLFHDDGSNWVYKKLTVKSPERGSTNLQYKGFLDTDIKSTKMSSPTFGHSDRDGKGAVHPSQYKDPVLSEVDFFGDGTSDIFQITNIDADNNGYWEKIFLTNPVSLYKYHRIVYFIPKNNVSVRLASYNYGPELLNHEVVIPLKTEITFDSVVYDSVGITRQFSGLGTKYDNALQFERGYDPKPKSWPFMVLVSDFFCNVEPSFYKGEDRNPLKQPFEEIASNNATATPMSLYPGKNFFDYDSIYIKASGSSKLFKLCDVNSKFSYFDFKTLPEDNEHDGAGDSKTVHIGPISDTLYTFRINNVGKEFKLFGMQNS